VRLNFRLFFVLGEIFVFEDCRILFAVEIVFGSVFSFENIFQIYSK